MSTFKAYVISTILMGGETSNVTGQYCYGWEPQSQI